jgi:hypothetical protein
LPTKLIFEAVIVRGLHMWTKLALYKRKRLGVRGKSQGMPVWIKEALVLYSGRQRVVILLLMKLPAI